MPYPTHYPEMVLNGYVIFSFAFAALRLGVGALLLFHSRRQRGLEGGGADEQLKIESHRHLLSVLGFLAFTLGVAGWGLFAVTLQSLVVETPSAMCLYGVFRVGQGAPGAAGWLPGIMVGLLILKPALVLASGTWLCLHLVDRVTRTGPLARGIRNAVTAVGALAAGDALLELSYYLWPRVERAASACCTLPFSGVVEGAAWPGALLSRIPEPAVTIGFYAGACLLGLAVLVLLRSKERLRARVRGFAALVGGPVLLLALWIFLARVIAPRVLAQPTHYCPFDLVTRAPLAVLGASALTGASFCLVWAWVCASALRSEEAFMPAARVERTLGRAALFQLVAGVAALSIELLIR